MNDTLYTALPSAESTPCIFRSLQVVHVPTTVLLGGTGGAGGEEDVLVMEPVGATVADLWP